MSIQIQLKYFYFRKTNNLLQGVGEIHITNCI